MLHVQLAEMQRFVCMPAVVSGLGPKTVKTGERREKPVAGERHKREPSSGARRTCSCKQYHVDMRMHPWFAMGQWMACAEGVRRKVRGQHELREREGQEWWPAFRQEFLAQKPYFDLGPVHFFLSPLCVFTCHFYFCNVCLSEGERMRRGRENLLTYFSTLGAPYVQGQSH